MRGAHAARAVLLLMSCCFSEWAAAGQFVRAPDVSFDARSSALTELETTRVPGGFVSLCERDPSFCQPAGEAPRDLILSPERWELLSEVNADVNHRIASTTDQKLYGTPEYWTIPTTAGDCEDYVLLKRQTLMGFGIPESSLLITVVHDENGEGHAVLTVPTTGGDIVLDNRRDEIMHWWATGYTFIKRQSVANPLRWVSLGREKLQATNIASGPEAP